MAIKLGSTEIKKAYLGSTLIFDSTGGIIPIGNLIRYYRFNNDVTDEVGLGNGTPSNITYVTGKSGQAADFNGSSSYVSVPDSNDLSFTDGANDNPFSVSFYIKPDAINLSNKMILWKIGGSSDDHISIIPGYKYYFTTENRLINNFWIGPYLLYSFQTYSESDYSYEANVYSIGITTGKQSLLGKRKNSCSWIRCF